MNIKQTNKILVKLKECGFRVTSPNEKEYGVEIISEEYFNEKINEALEEDLINKGEVWEE